MPADAMARWRVQTVVAPAGWTLEEAKRSLCDPASIPNLSVFASDPDFPATVFTGG